MSEIQYGLLPQLEKQLAAAQEAEHKDFKLVQDRVTDEEIAEVVSRWTGIPVNKMLEGERDKLLRMEEVLHNRVVGQEEAIKVVSDAVRRSRAGLSDPNRPAGSFLFLGPTGVGKTELCKALAEFLFDSADAMIRIDMSEFMEAQRRPPDRCAPGYVGYEEGGYLTEAVRRRPYSLILLDEVEKAHPDVFNILLQVLDDGRLTDGQGRTVDFRNTVIVMTSNLGSHQIQDMSTDDSPEAYTQMKAAVMGVVQAHFRPEFINRLDDIVVFHPLDKQQIKQIARIQMRGLEKRLAERGLKLAVSDAAFDLLGNVGFDPVYGARPLKRAIQSQLENPLAQQILSGAFVSGDTIEVGNEGGRGLRQGLNRWRACHGWRAAKPARHNDPVSLSQDEENRMDVTRRVSLCMALALAAVAGHAAAVEQVQLPPMKGYQQAHQSTDAQGNRITEYVPQGQTVQDWTDMVTVNDAPNGGHVSPREFLGIIEAGWRMACPAAQSHWIREGEEGGRPFALLMLSCPLNPGTGKPEFTWIRACRAGRASTPCRSRSAPSRRRTTSCSGSAGCARSACAAAAPHKPATDRSERGRPAASFMHQKRCV